MSGFIENYNTNKYLVTKISPNRAKYHIKLVNKRLAQKAIKNLQLMPKYSVL